MPQQLKEVLKGEERQRLKDFAEQYDLIKREKFSLTDAASVDGDFKFWRALLREMLDLHRKYPTVLSEQAGDQGLRIAGVLDAILEAKGLPYQEQVRRFRPRLQEPLVADFLVLLNSRVLVELLPKAPQESPQEPVQGVIGQFTDKLRRFTLAVDAAVTTGKRDAVRATQEFEGFLAGLSDQELEKNLDIIFDLLWEADKDTAGILVNGMSDAAILRLFDTNPAATMNGHVRPQRLLATLNITADAPQGQLTSGMLSLLDNTSGNAQIDRPFTDLAYDILAKRGTEKPVEVLAVLKEAQVPLSAQPFSGFTASPPRAASAILGADLETSQQAV